MSWAFHHRGFFKKKAEATLEPYATGLLVPGQLGFAIGQPIPGLDSSGLKHLSGKLFATVLLVLEHLGFAIGRPTAFARTSGKRGSSETATTDTWFSGLHLVTCLKFLNGGDSLSLCHSGVLHLFEKKDDTASESLPAASL